MVIVLFATLANADNWVEIAAFGEMYLGAVGNPCRVMRLIGEHDRKYYFKDREIDPEESFL